MTERERSEEDENNSKDETSEGRKKAATPGAIEDEEATGGSGVKSDE